MKTKRWVSRPAARHCAPSARTRLRRQGGKAVRAEVLVQTALNEGGGSDSDSG